MFGKIPWKSWAVIGLGLIPIGLQAAEPLHDGCLRRMRQDQKEVEAQESVLRRLDQRLLDPSLSSQKKDQTQSEREAQQLALRGLERRRLSTLADCASFVSVTETNGNNSGAVEESSSVKGGQAADGPTQIQPDRQPSEARSLGGGGR